MTTIDKDVEIRVWCEQDERLGDYPVFFEVASRFPRRWVLTRLSKKPTNEKLKELTSISKRAIEIWSHREREVHRPKISLEL